MPKESIARSTVAWFLREDWDELKRLSVDLQDTFDEWLAVAEAGVAAHAAQGFFVEKIILRPADLLSRQRAIGRKIKAKDRAKLAARKAIDADKTGALH